MGKIVNDRINTGKWISFATVVDKENCFASDTNAKTAVRENGVELYQSSYHLYERRHSHEAAHDPEG